MTSLLDLLETQPAPSISRTLPLDERFTVWRERHSEVVEFVTRRALAAARNGARRLSAKGLVEEARSSSLVTVAGRSDFKIDNTMVSRLATYLVDTYPELDGLFEMRRRRAS